jgi:hypothetical protein
MFPFRSLAVSEGIACTLINAVRDIEEEENYHRRSPHKGQDQIKRITWAAEPQIGPQLL